METTPVAGLPDDTLTTGQAANLAKVCSATVWRWVLRGIIPGWRRNGRTLVSRADVLALVSRVSKGKAAAATEPLEEKRKRNAWTAGVLRKWGLPT